MLALARAIAGRPALGLRLLVIGEGSEALWHTGVVDHVPPGEDNAVPLLEDLRLMQAAGCRTVLTEHPAGLPSAMRAVRLDEHFDPIAWLATWETARNAA